MSATYLAEVLKKWRNIGGLQCPPDDAIQLGQEGYRSIYVTDGWGPPVPYPSFNHGDGNVNHGYTRLKGNLDAILQVPEVVGWPEYQDFLEKINSDGSPIESVGCEKHLWPVSKGDAKWALGSYTDVIFSLVALNDDPECHLKLAVDLSHALDKSEDWWGTAEFCLSVMKGMRGCHQPYNLMIRLCGHGRDQDQARASWAASVRLVGRAVVELPMDYPLGR